MEVPLGPRPGGECSQSLLSKPFSGFISPDPHADFAPPPFERSLAKVKAASTEYALFLAVEDSDEEVLVQQVMRPESSDPFFAIIGIFRRHCPDHEAFQVIVGNVECLGERGPITRHERTQNEIGGFPSIGGKEVAHWVAFLSAALSGVGGQKSGLHHEDARSTEQFLPLG